MELCRAGVNRLPEVGSAVKLLKRCFALVSSHPLPGQYCHPACTVVTPGQMCPLCPQCPGEGEKQRLNFQDEECALFLALY